MKVGLYFGSFNPVHVGHLIIANHFAQNTDLDEVWFVVSPQNPLKNKASLLADYHRLELTRIATESNESFRVSDIEFKLDYPSYTCNTLAVLSEKYPGKQFSLIMGEDNLRSFHKWKNYENIIHNHQVLVYPRVLTPGEEEKQKTKQMVFSHSNVKFEENAPMMKISASYIRNLIKEGKSTEYLLTPEVEKYVDEMNFYR